MNCRAFAAALKKLILEINMSGNKLSKQLAYAYAAVADKWFDPLHFKGQTRIPHNSKNNRRTKPKGKKK